MKKIIFILTFLLTGTIFVYSQDCDTLKIKVIETNYCKSSIGDITGKLEGAEINIDTLPVLYNYVEIVNISGDTFYKEDVMHIYTATFVYYLYDNDTTRQLYNAIAGYYFPRIFLPNDTLRLYVEIPFYISDVLSKIEQKDTLITMLNRTRCDMIHAIVYTSKDGSYSERVWYAGADTATFYIIRNKVDVSILETEQKNISIFPNPAQAQITVTNAQDALLRLYNILGQEVLQTHSIEENIIINTSYLPKGLYVLKVEKENAIHIRKIQIVK
jgi:hypothetical protein